jgi:hypothetical protein
MPSAPQTLNQIFRDQQLQALLATSDAPRRENVTSLSTAGYLPSPFRTAEIFSRSVPSRTALRGRVRIRTA